MTNEAWVRGMTELVASLPTREQEPAVLAVRGDVYRRKLDDLTDDRWLYAVDQAIEHERWFPTVAALREYAESAGAPALPALPPHRMTEEEKAEAREMSRKGLEMCREAFRRVTGEEPAAEPVKDMPAAAGEEV